MALGFRVQGLGEVFVDLRWEVLLRVFQRSRRGFGGLGKVVAGGPFALGASWSK